MSSPALKTAPVAGVEITGALGPRFDEILTPEALASLLQNMNRSSLLERAQAAERLKQINATSSVVAACEELAS